MGLNNVSERIESHGDEIREELNMCEGSVFEAIKNMSKEELAEVIETNYKDKEAKDIELDHGWAAVVQAALTHLGYGNVLGEIDGVYGNKTRNAATAYQLSKKLTGSGWAMNQTLWKMIIDLRDPTYVADFSSEDVTKKDKTTDTSDKTPATTAWVVSEEQTTHIAGDSKDKIQFSLDNIKPELIDVVSESFSMNFPFIKSEISKMWIDATMFWKTYGLDSANLSEVTISRREGSLVVNLPKGVNVNKVDFQWEGVFEQNTEGDIVVNRQNFIFALGHTIEVESNKLQLAEKKASYEKIAQNIVVKQYSLGDLGLENSQKAKALMKNYFPQGKILLNWESTKLDSDINKLLIGFSWTGTGEEFNNIAIDTSTIVDWTGLTLDETKRKKELGWVIKKISETLYT